MAIDFNGNSMLDKLVKFSKGEKRKLESKKFQYFFRQNENSICY